MKILEPRTRTEAWRFFIRWQLLAVALAMPGHLLFIARGLGARVGVGQRGRLAIRLCGIHLRLQCAHSPLELLTITENIVSLPASTPGVVVECGTWLGGSTAKLSLACAAVNRRLLACDSFQGLPDLGPADILAAKDPFAPGDFATHLDMVRENIARFGVPGAVTFVPGWYRDTLPRLPANDIACAFLDVDLKSSIEDCVRGLWSRLAPGARVFVHDVDRPGVVEPFRDARFWSDEVRSPAPRFVGEASGLGPLRRCLGYATKN